MAETDAEYIIRKDIPRVLDSVLAICISKKPEDPFALMSTEFRNRSSQGAPGAAGSQGATSGASWTSDAVAALDKVIAGAQTDIWVKPFDPALSAAYKHQFAVFLKPESTNKQAGVDVLGIANLLHGILDKGGVTVGAIRVLGGPYLDKQDIISQHYGVIAKISRQGRSAISAAAEQKLKELFAAQLAEGAQVLGGHQFLEVEKGFTPYSLWLYGDNVGNKKLAGGTYAVSIKMQGNQYIVLNAFHPQQLVPFTSPGKAVVAFECLSNTSWKSLRNDICGATDPTKAEAGSFRNLFLTCRQALGVSAVNSSANGLHLSAGPLEGMVELLRFLMDERRTIEPLQTSFGKLLSHEGISANDIGELLRNPTFPSGVSAFDLTEEHDAEGAAQQLKANVGGIVHPVLAPGTSDWNPEVLHAALLKVVADDSSTHDLWVRPFDPTTATSSKHQFIAFLKPEATDVHSGVDALATLRLLHDTFTKASITVGAIRVLGGPYLDKQDIISQHYGVIAKISRQGKTALSVTAQQRLAELFGAQIAAGAQVLGGHQFLAAEPSFTPLSLATFNEMVGSTKLAGGSYAVHLTVKGAQYIVLNAFHPQQLVPFTSKGRGIVVLEGLSNAPWKALRNDVCGATDPTKAAAGSFRNQFLASREKFHVSAVNSSANGLHLSAGPLEGMVELLRFFRQETASIPTEKTSFGHHLVTNGFTVDNVSALCENPTIPGEAGGVSAFDLTEEDDAEEATTKLKKAVLGH
eukprot:TRINITY_DN222_c0_g1_i5.p1 TRINITY_DN222_c0_g1~~TRINITY_DN222_c0_g1_i5.p1  ORF type:complete len:749 (+),score=162.02 TRINITY_DN222_c0_g1_i5:1641-3887(+)